MKAKLKTKLAKAGVAAASAASLACAFPTLAFASEEKEGIAVLIPDMNEFIPMLVAFIIILIVLAKFGWPVVDNIITKRESTIKEALKKSEEAQAEAERTLAEYKRQLEEAKAQSAKIIADAKATGEAVKADITNKAQAESAQIDRKGSRCDRGREEGRCRRAAGFYRRFVRQRGFSPCRPRPERR